MAEVWLGTLGGNCGGKGFLPESNHAAHSFGLILLRQHKPAVHHGDLGLEERAIVI